MSDRAVEELTDSIRRLTVVADRLASALEGIEQVTAPPEEDLEPDLVAPYHLQQLGLSKLSNKPPGAKARVQSAFAAGVRAGRRIYQDCPYTPREPVEGKNHHWVVLRATNRDSFRTTSYRDLVGLVRLTDQLLICEAFESLTEVEIFCRGAQRPIPPLLKC